MLSTSYKPGTIPSTFHYILKTNPAFLASFTDEETDTQELKQHDEHN